MFVPFRNTMSTLMSNVSLWFSSSLLPKLLLMVFLNFGVSYFFQVSNELRSSFTVGRYTCIFFVLACNSSSLGMETTRVRLQILQMKFKFCAILLTVDYKRMHIAPVKSSAFFCKPHWAIKTGPLKKIFFRKSRMENVKGYRWVSFFLVVSTKRWTY